MVICEEEPNITLQMARIEIYNLNKKKIVKKIQEFIPKVLMANTTVNAMAIWIHNQ